jgi:hypothetical protein
MFLACQHLNLETNARECEDHSWFKVQAVTVSILINVRCFHIPPVEDHCYSVNNSSKTLLIMLCSNLMYTLLLLQEVVLDG